MMCMLASFLLAVALPLEQGFVSPPPSARPHVWWPWMNGNVTECGIAADLAMLAESGFGGATVVDIGGGTPKGPVHFGSEDWLDRIEFAAKESIRLDLELCLANGSGWSSSGGPWVKPEDSMKHLVWTSIEVSGPGRFDGALTKPEDKFGFYSDIAVVAQSKDSPERCVVVTTECSKRLDWEVPPGKWTLYRFGYASNGKCSIAASAAGRGLECDKFDAVALGAHFESYIGNVVRRLKSKGMFRPGERRGLTSVLIDSYEVGDQNWTRGFERVFRERRGYDPIPFLPFIACSNAPCAMAKAFLRDMGTTCEELFQEGYADAMRRKCHEYGLQLLVEPYGRNMPGLNRSFKEGYLKASDLPMAEFWAKEASQGHWDRCRRIARIARKAGMRIVGAEAFTAWPEQDRWSLSPFDLKPVGDMAFKCGINRLYLHSFVHQPWSDAIRPGMTMDKFGTHFDRNSTWWPMAREWVRYLARCQFLLQEGVPDGDFTEDVLHLRYADGTDGFFVATTNMVQTQNEFLLPVSGREPELWNPVTGGIEIADEWHQDGAATAVRVPLGPCGSMFVMFKPRNTRKCFGHKEHREHREELGVESGELRETLNPQPSTLNSLWTLEIAGREVTLPSLMDWTQFLDEDIRHFSGTAVYRTELRLPEKFAEKALDGRHRIVLDLGAVGCFAKVTANGIQFPALWAPPFEVDVTEALSCGSVKGCLKLEVKVANLWANRLIGDDSIPGDVGRRGPYAREIPSWVRSGGPIPNGRHTFSVYRHWTKHDRPLPSGLCGPATLKVRGESGEVRDEPRNTRKCFGHKEHREHREEECSQMTNVTSVHKSQMPQIGIGGNVELLPVANSNFQLRRLLDGTIGSWQHWNWQHFHNGNISLWPL